MAEIDEPYNYRLNDSSLDKHRHSTQYRIALSVSDNNRTVKAVAGVSGNSSKYRNSSAGAL